MECFKCGISRGKSDDIQRREEGEDWICRFCDLVVFAKSSKCFRCKKGKKDAEKRSDLRSVLKRRASPGPPDKRLRHDYERSPPRRWASPPRGRSPLRRGYTPPPYDRYGPPRYDDRYDPPRYPEDRYRRSPPPPDRYYGPPPGGRYTPPPRYMSPPRERYGPPPRGYPDDRGYGPPDDRGYGPPSQRYRSPPGRYRDPSPGRYNRAPSPGRRGPSPGYNRGPPPPRQAPPPAARGRSRSPPPRQEEPLPAQPSSTSTPMLNHSSKSVTRAPPVQQVSDHGNQVGNHGNQADAGNSYYGDVFEEDQANDSYTGYSNTYETSGPAVKRSLLPQPSGIQVRIDNVQDPPYQEAVPVRNQQHENRGPPLQQQQHQPTHQQQSRGPPPPQRQQNRETPVPQRAPPPQQQRVQEPAAAVVMDRSQAPASYECAGCGNFNRAEDKCCIKCGMEKQGPGGAVLRGPPSPVARAPPAATAPSSNTSVDQPQQKSEQPDVKAWVCVSCDAVNCVESSNCHKCSAHIEVSYKRKFLVRLAAREDIKILFR
eukprot:sb/3463698/